MTPTRIPAIPKYVTRFYGNPDYGNEVIHDLEIAFTHKSVLNDPFDPYLFFETDFNENYSALMDHIKQQHPREFEALRNHISPNSWDAMVTDMRKYLTNHNDSAFLFCTSANDEDHHPETNLYLWGHYGAGHRGLAIEFNVEALTSAVLNHPDNKNTSSRKANELWDQIEYRDTIGPITAEFIYEYMWTLYQIDQRVREESDLELTNLYRYYRKMTSTKSDAWAPEKEWRLMWKDNSEKRLFLKFPIDPRAIHKIFLGLSLPKLARSHIIQDAKTKCPRAVILQAKKRYGHIALEFERV
jgi:hypothetical protein